MKPTSVDKILVEDCSPVDVELIDQLVEKIKSACSNGDAGLVFDILKNAPVGLVSPETDALAYETKIDLAEASQETAL